MTEGLQQNSGIRELVHHNVWNFYTLPKNAQSRVVDARELLSPNRLDLMARTIYIRHHVLGHGRDWGTQVYRNLLQSWHKDCYVGDGQKNTFADSLNHFDALIDDMRTNGFDRSKGIIPHVGDTVVDGAHRLACCLYFNQKAEVVELEGDKQVQNAGTLLRIGMDPVIVEQMVLEYLRRDVNTYVACLFPVCSYAHKVVEQVLEHESTLIYRLELSLTYQGQCNFIKRIYAHEDWWNNELVPRFVADRFSTKAPMVLYFLKFSKGANVRAAKERVRAIFNIGNHPMHVNDTHEETCFIAEAVLNPNSRHHLNTRQPNALPNFAANLRTFREALAAAQIAPDNICIDSSSVLAAYGYRDARDIDYLTVLSPTPLPDTEAYGLHNGEYNDFPVPVEQMIYDPHYHFYFNGLKFLSLDMTMLMKWKRGTPKDIADCRLLLEAPKPKIEVLQITPLRHTWRRRLRLVWDRVFSFGVVALSKILPKSLYGKLRQKFRDYKAGRS